MDSKMYKTPNEAELLALMDRTGYQMIQENGQRKYGPPPDWVGKPPPRGCEIFVGKIPRNCYENELVPAFEKIGKIYEFRLMMDFSGCNRGYCFVMYTNKEDAKRAIQEMNNYEIRKGHYLGVCASVDNCRLFVGGIPKDKQKHEIMTEIEKVTDGVVDVIVYADVSDKTKNRGFAFVEYASHRDAAMARRKLVPGKIKLFGNPIAVDWAEPEKEVAEDVKVLYVRNLMLGTTEDTLRNVFNMAVGRRDAVERIKKIKDYAFIHFTDRHDAEKALATINGNYLEGSMVEVMFAKPIDKESYIRYTKNIGGHHTTAASKEKCLISEQLKQLSVQENKQSAFNASSSANPLFLPNGLVGARPNNSGMLYNANFSGFASTQLKSILPLPLFQTAPPISPHPLIPFHPRQVTSIANQSPMAYVYNTSSAVDNNPYLQSSLSLKMDPQFAKHFPFKVMEDARLKARQVDGCLRDHGGGDNPSGFRSS